MSDFLRLVLQRMSFAQMANSLNSSKSPSRGLLEAHHRNEFQVIWLPCVCCASKLQCLHLVLQCRACVSLLPPGAHLSPDVGPVFGVAGRMDFMLLPLKWGFELLTDGQAIKEHVNRQIQQRQLT